MPWCFRKFEIIQFEDVLYLNKICTFPFLFKAHAWIFPSQLQILSVLLVHSLRNMNQTGPREKRLDVMSAMDMALGEWKAIQFPVIYKRTSKCLLWLKFHIQMGKMKPQQRISVYQLQTSLNIFNNSFSKVLYAQTQPPLLGFIDISFLLIYSHLSFWGHYQIW